YRVSKARMTPEGRILCAKDIAAPKIGADHIDSLANKIETMLDNASQNDRFAHTVALTAGRYAAMQLFQLHGRAQTLSFFEDCIQTVELCDDLLKQMDDDF
ncbi:MAG: hypothetical protein ACPHAP_08200, partial [Candidatus Puniceispirillaceae bacterium]